MLSDRSAPGDPGEVDAWTRAVEARRSRDAPLLDLTLESPEAAGLAFDHAMETGAHASTAEAALVAAGRAPHVGRVVLVGSPVAAHAHLLTLLADPGDEVLVPAPGDPRLAHAAHLGSVALVPYPCRYDGRWRADMAALFDAVSDRTRAIVAASPSPVTGAYLDRDDLEGLAALGIPLVVDETLHGYPLEPPADCPRACTLDGLEAPVFAIDGAIDGLGWISVAGPDATVAAAIARLRLVAEVHAPPHASRVALPAALVRSAERDAVRARVAASDAALREALTGTAVELPRVEGGWRAAVRLPATRTDEAYALALLEAGVLARPGHLDDFPDDEAWLSLSLLAGPDQLRRGAAQLARLAGRGPGRADPASLG